MRQAVVALFALLAGADAVKARAASDCFVTARYDDGTEIERCAITHPNSLLRALTKLTRAAVLRARECIVEGQMREKAAPKKGVSEEMAWLKDTRWLWNQWREVCLFLFFTLRLRLPSSDADVPTAGDLPCGRFVPGACGELRAAGQPEVQMDRRRRSHLCRVWWRGHAHSYADG